jgi:hypothetical protein
MGLIVVCETLPLTLRKGKVYEQVTEKDIWTYET